MAARLTSPSGFANIQASQSFTGPRDALGCQLLDDLQHRNASRVLARIC
jgi:hypothetical protein